MKENSRPVIILAGLGQSRIAVTDESGNKLKNAWPLDLDEKQLMKELQGPLMKTMLFRKDAGFSDAVENIARAMGEPLFRKPDGSSKFPLKVQRLSESYAESSSEDKKYIDKMVPISELCQAVGEDNIFYFSYNFLGDARQEAQSLDSFIKEIKSKKGCDKVSLLSFSIGGALLIAYFADYAEECDIARVVSVSSTLNGSKLISALLSGQLNTSDAGSVMSMLGSRADEIAPMISMFPANAIENAASKALRLLIDNIVKASSLMWAAVPAEDYPLLSGDLIHDEEFKKECDLLNEAVSTFPVTVKRLSASGVEFFNICGYGLPLARLVTDSGTDSDSVVDTASASLGAVLTDGELDLSKAALPGSTWFFKNQPHNGFAKNDIARALTARLLSDDDFKSVNDDADFPQFNCFRDEKAVSELMQRAREMLDTADEEKAAIINSALESAEDFLAKKIVPECGSALIEARLKSAME